MTTPFATAIAPHANMVEHLTAPLATGAAESELEIRADGSVSVPAARQPAVLIAPRRALGAAVLLVHVTVDGTARPSLRFAPYTEAAAALVAHRPAVAESGSAAGCEIALSAELVAPDGTAAAIDAAELGSTLRAVVLEGILGRVLYTLGAEKTRLAREARELARMRSLSVARDDALDRAGAELGVPRLADEIITEDGRVTTRAAREPDVDYRRRLRIYAPMLLPSRSALERLVNGSGEPGQPNAGPLGELGLQPRFDVVEEDNPFAVAVHLVERGAGTTRDAFLAFVRNVYLVEPLVDTPAARFIHSSERTKADALRTRLRDAFDWQAGQAIAPVLARVLDRAGRCLAALLPGVRLEVTRAQDATAGSRFELGLGVEIVHPDVARVTDLANALSAIDLDAVEPEVRGLLRAMDPRPAIEDPSAAWFFEPCGFRTVHPPGGGRLYLSHLPTFGLAISGPSTSPAGAIQLEARYHGPGDPGKDAVLLAGLSAARDQFIAAGGAAWTELDDATGLARIEALPALPANAPALDVLRRAGLPAFADPAQTRLRLKAIAPELFQVLELADAQSARIVAGDGDAPSELRGLVNALAAQGLASAVAFVDPGGAAYVVTGVTGLPEAGLNLADRRSTGFRWYSVPLHGPAGAITPAGSRATFTPGGEGLVAVVCVAYSRRGATDPFEFRVELPQDAVLDIRQYEFLMNVLDHAHPAGVEVNTFNIRRRHVDLDGDGVADPLTPAVSRTYRQFRRLRHRGEAAVTLEQP